MRLLVAAFAISVFANMAIADGQATISSPTPEGVKAIEIAWRGDDLVRIDIQGQSTYMIARQGTLYAVTDAGGMGIQVMDLSSLEKMAESLPSEPESPGAGMNSDLMQERAVEVLSMEPTGREETVAGIDGELYEVTWRSESGETRTENAVLSDDPLAVELDRAFAALRGVTSQGEADARQVAVSELGMGLLRLSDHYEVTSASRDTRPESAFELPAEPMNFGDMMGGFGGGQ